MFRRKITWDTVNSHERKRLRAKAHHLKPVVLIGQGGLSEEVLAEVNLALDYHELIKVRIRSVDRDFRREAAVTLCEKTRAEPVQRIGQILVIYRKITEKTEAKTGKSRTSVHNKRGANRAHIRQPNRSKVR